MSSDQDFLQQLLATFKVELDERVESLNKSLLALEGGGDTAELVDQIFREAHSLKGAARAVEIKEIEEVAHVMETLLAEVKNGRPMTKPMFSVLFKSVDFFSAAMTARLAGGSLSEQEVHEFVEKIEKVRSGGDAAPIKKKTASSKAAKAGAGKLVQVEQGREAPATSESVPSSGTAKKQDSEPPPEVATGEESQPSAQTQVVELEPPPPTDPSTLDPDVPKRMGDNRRAGPEDRRKRDRRLDDALLAKETIRVSTSKLDSLLAQAGELLVAKIKISQLHEDIKGIYSATTQLEKFMAEMRRAMKSVLNGSSQKMYETGQERARAVSRTMKKFMKVFSVDMSRLHTLTSELQEEIKKIRMLPVGLVFDSFYRMVRDLCEVKKKQVVMTTGGGECALDKKLIEALKDPLMHLIRNAIDHGIESPDIRTRHGKPAQGKLHLSARQKGDIIIISVQDDGTGIDLDAVKQKAIKRGFMSEEEARTFSEREIINHIFKSGFSTSPIIDDISGRGIGLDVVRSAVERMNGTLDVTTIPGAGTTFIMQLPLTVSTFQGLLVRLGGQVFILPISSVEQIRRVSRSDIRRLGTSETIQIEDLPIQLARMARLLGLEESQKPPAEKLVAVILGSVEKRVAFLVDELLGEQEVILKSLSKPIIKVRYVAGATILGSGEIVMILNVAELVNASLQVHAPVRQTATRKQSIKRTKTVLVVDDSITTRMLEKNILETAGFHVL